jgi:hypothetical protein
MIKELLELQLVQPGLFLITMQLAMGIIALSQVRQASKEHTWEKCW